MSDMPNQDPVPTVPTASSTESIRHHQMSPINTPLNDSSALPQQGVMTRNAIMEQAVEPAHGMLEGDVIPISAEINPVLSDHGARTRPRVSKRTHQRAVTAVRISDMIEPQEISASLHEDATEASSKDPLQESAGTSQSEPDASGARVEEAQQPPSSPLSASDNGAESLTAELNESGSSSESVSTVVGPSSEGKDHRTKRDRRNKELPSAKLHALQYLDSDSPSLSSEAIRHSFPHYRSTASPTSTSPSGRSATSSHRSSIYSDGHSELADLETDRSTSPERSPPHGSRHARSAPQWSRRHRSYGTPEMPRGNADLPHISPQVLTSRVAGQPHGHIAHLPRAEKLPLTGYEQLACHLASQGSDRSGPYLRPMYRRFEMLNHRLLLHLQDELCELEEQLHRLDTTDTQTRRLHNGILPASRRAEAMAGSELQWHKADILGRIGFKLEQYSKSATLFAAEHWLTGQIEFYHLSKQRKTLRRRPWQMSTSIGATL